MKIHASCIVSRRRSPCPSARDGPLAAIGQLAAAVDRMPEARGRETVTDRVSHAPKIVKCRKLFLAISITISQHAHTYMCVYVCAIRPYPAGRAADAKSLYGKLQTYYKSKSSKAQRLEVMKMDEVRWFDATSVCSTVCMCGRISNGWLAFSVSGVAFLINGTRFGLHFYRADHSLCFEFFSLVHRTARCWTARVLLLSGFVYFGKALTSARRRWRTGTGI